MASAFFKIFELLGAHRADDADGQARARERLTEHDVLRQAQRQTELADLILEEVVKRLDQIEVHAIGERDEVVMALDGGRLAARLARATLDDVRVDGALGQVLHRSAILLELLGHGEELVPELRADDAALLLGVGHTVEQRSVALLGMHVHEVDVELLGKDFLDLLGLTLAQQTVIDENAGHLTSHRTGAQCGNHGGVHAAGQRQDHAVLAHSGAELLCHGLNQVVHGPVLLKAADVEQEVPEQLLAVLGVLDFGVELRGVDAALGVLHGGNRAHGGARGHGEPLGHAGDGVAVAHPHGLLKRRGVEELTLAVAFDRRGAVLADLGVAHLAAERDGGHLMTVAKAQNRQAQLINGRVDRGRILGVDGRGAAGEDERGRRHLAHLVGRDVARDDLGIHMQIAHATGDELRILCAEVEDQHLLRGPLGCILGHEPSQLNRHHGRHHVHT